MNDDLDPAEVTNTSSEAAEKATGKPWAEWMTLLDEAGGRAMNHKQLVAHLKQHFDVSSWWQQGIAVTYEKSRRLRETHEMPGGYEISRSRTLAAAVAQVYEAWTDEAMRRRWLPGLDLEPRTARPNKSARFGLDDGTNIEVSLTEKGAEKTTVTVRHNKLRDGDASEHWKAYWVEALGRLGEFVAGAE